MFRRSVDNGQEDFLVDLKISVQMVEVAATRFTDNPGGFVNPISLSDLELQPFTGVGSWTVFRIKNGLVVVLLN
ncbi:hypothetical protein Q3G72_011069 [Acer saccharum]|nr:hypothetical protein Q3G72_011069 [Acer saccharum]